MRGILLGLPFLLFIQISAASSRSLPPPPPSFIFDEAKVLDTQTENALQNLFKAQERTTGDQIVFAIFKSLDGEDVVQWTNRIFHSWKIGQKGKDNGILLAVYWKDHKARIEVGYGLEPKLTDAKSKRILAEILAPGLRRNVPDYALTQSALEILTLLESPLIQNGEATSILNGAHISHPSPSAQSGHGPARFVWIILSFFLLLIFGRAFFNRGDRKFERNTWHPSDPWSYRRRRGSGVLMNSGFGGLGGPGGGPSGGSSRDDNDFRGGGGDSGGGGASQDW